MRPLIALSPDGKQVAFCLATWDKPDQPRKTDLWEGMLT